LIFKEESIYKNKKGYPILSSLSYLVLIIPYKRVWHLLDA